MSVKSRNIQNKRACRKSAIRRLRSVGISHIRTNGINRTLGTSRNTAIYAMYKGKFGISIQDYRKKVSREREKISANKKRVARDSDDDFIYVMGNTEAKICKIGVSIDPYKRLIGVQTGCPYIIEIIKIFKGSYTIEKALHKKYAGYKLNGEWFRFEGELKTAIEMASTTYG